MDPLRKSNLSYSEKDSPARKGQDPRDTMNNTKKSFLSQLFTKKKLNDSQNLDTGMPKPAEANKSRTNTKNKLINRRNITDGRIRLNVVETDRVPEDYIIEYKDNPFDQLDMNPSRTTSYIENLRSRDFSQINNRQVKSFLEAQYEQDIAPMPHRENLELDLLELASSFESFLTKFFRFFQGLLPGFCILHLFLIFAGSSTQEILDAYALPGLRIYQIFQVASLLSTLGSFLRYFDTKTKSEELVRVHPLLREALEGQVKKHLISGFCFLIVYILVIINHEFVAKLSDEEDEILEENFSSMFELFRILSSAMAILGIIGWFTLIVALEEPGSDLNMIDYNDMTADEELETAGY